jgi:uncharacterized protein YcfJ
MWITLLQVLGMGVIALGVWAVLGVLVWAMSAYSVRVQRQSLETLVNAIRGRLPDVTRQAMDAYVAAPRRYEFWECLGRVPEPPWPLSEKEWQRLRDILRDLLRAVEETRDVESDGRVFAALLAVAPDCQQVAELKENRCRESEARQRRMHQWIDRSGDDFGALISGSRGWILRENMLLRRSALKEVTLPTLKRIVRDGGKAGTQHTTIGALVGAVLVLLFGSGEPSDVLACVGGASVVGLIVGLAIAVERVQREVLAAFLALDPPLLRVGKLLAVAGYALFFATVVALNRAGFPDANLWGCAVFVAIELSALGVLGTGWILQRHESKAS